MENHMHEISERKDTFLDLERATNKLQMEMKSELNSRQYVAFKMLFVQNKTEEQVATEYFQNKKQLDKESFDKLYEVKKDDRN